jgi:hypothetical protein
MLVMTKTYMNARNNMETRYLTGVTVAEGFITTNPSKRAQVKACHTSLHN